MAKIRGAKTGRIIGGREAEKREIIAWYRDMLAKEPPPVYGKYVPVKIGNTWIHDGVSWQLPTFSAGWEILAWCGLWLKAPDGKPWVFTPEQARFILWFQQLDENARYTYTSAVIQRLKGWGKDPMAAAIALALMLGGSIPDGFRDGEPVMRHNPVAWVQIFAVSQEQTKNTMKMFPQLLSAEARSYYGVQVGRQNVWALGDSVQIEAATSAPLSTEGNRPTFVIRNETQNWLANNSGHDLAGVIEGNLSKAGKDRPARMLDLCNAYREGEDSIGQQMREGWEQTQETIEGGQVVAAKREEFGLYYDSLEAPPEAPLTKSAIVEVVESVRGDADWLDVSGTILNSIMNPINSASESRRKWYNQIQADEEAWTTAQLWDSLADTETIVEDGEQITMFLDCSKSDDATALVGCRLLDGHRFVIGLWQKPAGKRGQGWLAPREAVDIVVREAFKKYTVAGFFADPSHALEDETMTRYWDGLIDAWHRDYSRKLRVWAKRGAKDSHSILFDMSHLDVQKQFVQQVALTEQEIIDKHFTHDGDARLRKHVLAAKRMPTKAGMSIGKTHRESVKKIDLAICMIGAGLVRRQVMNRGKSRSKGKIW